VVRGSRDTEISAGEIRPAVDVGQPQDVAQERVIGLGSRAAEHGMGADHHEALPAAGPVG
jgi:hypothetical protein